jgi:hypothetical protein
MFTRKQGLWCFLDSTPLHRASEEQIGTWNGASRVPGNYVGGDGMVDEIS